MKSKKWQSTFYTSTQAAGGFQGGSKCAALFMLNEVTLVKILFWSWGEFFMWRPFFPGGIGTSLLPWQTSPVPACFYCRAQSGSQDGPCNVAQGCNPMAPSSQGELVEIFMPAPSLPLIVFVLLVPPLGTPLFSTGFQFCMHKHATHLYFHCRQCQELA